MPSSRQQLVLNEFLALVSEGWRGLGSGETQIPPELTGASEAVKQAAAGLTETSRAQTQIMAGYASVVQSSPVYQAAQGDAGQGTVSRIASAVFQNALGMVPLARAVWTLFGGGGQEEPPPLVKYALPAALRFEAASSGGDFAGVDYGQDGLPRSLSQPYRQSESAAGQAAPQVTIQVQAMDSRSFLDHKDDIARAVREAMLSNHALNDVVSEL